MLRLLVFFSILRAVCCSCPDGWKLFAGGECGGLVEQINIRDDQAMQYAISKCGEVQGEIPIIHNADQQSYWKSKNRGPDIPIGLVCNSSSNQWEWVDGSALDYKPSNYDSDLDRSCKQGCSWFIYFSPVGSWTRHCDTVSHSYDIYCTVPIHPKLNEINDDACLFFDDDIDDGICYQVGDSAENWQDAQLSCLKLGANLASIHKLQENNFVRRLAVSKGAVTGLYLGATVAEKGNQFGWVDGSDWDYDNYAPGFPIPGFGDCIVMDTSTSTGQWMNIECSEKLPVACIRQHTVIPEPICSTGPFKEGDIITSPGFPFNASTPCDFYLKVDEQKRVEVEIQLLEANTCCDNLILYDGHVGGVVLANVNGEIPKGTKYTTTSANTMKVSWQPKGGVNVLGMAITYRGV